MPTSVTKMSKPKIFFISILLIGISARNMPNLFLAIQKEGAKELVLKNGQACVRKPGCPAPGDIPVARLRPAF
jgi:hypothetical protein